MDQSASKSIVYKSITQLVFDPLNPRLPSSIVSGDDEGAVIDWMLKDATIIELMGAIGEKGFFPAEPLLVVENGSSGIFEVIEGNRRLTAVKLLNNPDLATVKKKAVAEVSSEAKYKPDILPVFIYDTREEILDYLGFKHITGVKSWSALAKAKYLDQLQKQFPTDLQVRDRYQSLAKAIGSRASYVRDLLVGLSLFNKIQENDFFNIEKLSEDTIEFGVYYTALGRSNIPDYLKIDRYSDDPLQNLDIKRLEKLTRWLSEKLPNGQTKLGESRNLSKLNEIIVSDKALTAFEGGKSISEAFLLTDEPVKAFQNLIRNSYTNLQDANAQFHLVRTPTKSDLEIIQELSSLSRDLRKRITDRLDELEEEEQ